MSLNVRYYSNHHFAFQVYNVLCTEKLNSMVTVTNGILPDVHHFDSKAEVEEYILTLNIPATFFLAGFYMSNIPGTSLREMPNGKWGLALPMPANTPIPLFAAEHDTGKFVKAIFLNKETTLGKRIYGATAYVTPVEILETFKEVYPIVGRDASYTELPHDVFKGIMASTGAPEVVQEEMLQNMRLISEFGYYGGDSLGGSIAVGYFIPGSFPSREIEFK